MILALLLGCDAPAAADTSTPTAPTAGTDACTDAPAVDWANFGQGFVLGYCQPCHATGAPDRHGAPESVVFDAEADVVTWAERIRVRVLGDEGGMPPGGGVPPEDLALLEVWLDCGLTGG